MPCRSTKRRAPTPLLDGPYQGKTETSRAAAEAIDGRQFARDLDRVFDHLRSRASTDHETAEALDIPLDTARARRVALRDAGRVVDSGRRRSTPNGRLATVWAALPLDVAALAEPRRQPPPPRCWHVDPKYWRAEPAPGRPGWLRTTCTRCAAFVGYRPADLQEQKPVNTAQDSPIPSRRP